MIAEVERVYPYRSYFLSNHLYKFRYGGKLHKWKMVDANQNRIEINLVGNMDQAWGAAAKETWNQWRRQVISKQDQQ